MKPKFRLGDLVHVVRSKAEEITIYRDILTVNGIYFFEDDDGRKLYQYDIYESQSDPYEDEVCLISDDDYRMIKKIIQ